MFVTQRLYVMYLLKTKGTAKIPDYIQVRDNDFVLVDHFKADISLDKLRDKNLFDEPEKTAEIIKKLPIGILTKI